MSGSGARRTNRSSVLRLHANGTVARLGVVTFFGNFSDPGLIQSEAGLVLTGIRHDKVSAHAKDYAAQLDFGHLCGVAGCADQGVDGGSR